MSSSLIPQEGYLRLRQIIGDPKNGILPLIPVSRSLWYEGVRSGRFPKSVRLSARTVAWAASDVRELIERLGRGAE